MWYHDHAVGITRLNAYAGIASGMLIRDKFEAGLINKGLPNFVEAGGNEIPLVFQDKIFVGPDILPHRPDLARARRRPAASGTPTSTSPTAGSWHLAASPFRIHRCIPEFFGDTMLVNGTVFPQATVQARRYRLRLLNACNARFLNLQLYVADGSQNGITLDSERHPDERALHQRRHGRSVLPPDRHRGGLPLEAGEGPVQRAAEFPDAARSEHRAGRPVADPASPSLVAPAERPDLIVDFKRLCREEHHPLRRRARSVPERRRPERLLPGLEYGEQPGQRHSTHERFWPQQPRPHAVQCGRGVRRADPTPEHRHGHGPDTRHRSDPAPDVGMDRRDHTCTSRSAS